MQTVESASDRQVGSSLDLPRISIVVPNYQGGDTIGKTLQSLIDQNYPNLEIVVVDGGSTDASLDTIRQFEPHIGWWTSEPDRGQSDAINKGFAHCTGDVVNWLCSDDLLVEHALLRVGEAFARSPEIDVVVGQCLTQRNTKGRRSFSKLSAVKSLNRWAGVDSVDFQPGENQSFRRGASLQQIDLMPARNPIPQPSCFYRRSLLQDRSQPLDETYHYVMDFELWSYFKSQGARWKCIDDVLSISCQTETTKTSTGGYQSTLEHERIYNTYSDELIPLSFWYKWLRHPLECYMEMKSGSAWVYVLAPAWIAITVTLAPFYGWRRVWAMKWSRRRFG